MPSNTAGVWIAGLLCAGLIADIVLMWIAMRTAPADPEETLNPKILFVIDIDKNGKTIIYGVKRGDGVTKLVPVDFTKADPNGH